MAKNRPSKIVTKKHLARLERERRQIRLISFSAIGIIIAVILLVGYGMLKQTVFQAIQPIVAVNGEKVSTREFQGRVRLARQQLINQYIQYYQFAQMFGIDPSTDSYFSQPMGGIESKLSSASTMGDETIQQLINELLIRQEAKKRGIVVTADEIDQRIRGDFNYYPDGTPTQTITPTAVPFSTLSPTQRTLVTLTPTIAPQATATINLTPTTDTSLTPTAIPVTSTPTSIPPTATPYTLDGFQSEYQTNLDNFVQIGMTEADFRKIYENQLIREKLFAVITADLTNIQEEVWARHILVQDEATAELIRAMLLDGGDFATLAAQYSTDTSNKDTGGDLGWFPQGQMVTEFDTAAFALKIGEISQPIQTIHGYHIIQVLGHEVRTLNAEEYKSFLDLKFFEWLTAVKSEADIKTYDYWLERVPTDPDLQTIMNQVLGQ